MGTKASEWNDAEFVGVGIIIVRCSSFFVAVEQNDKRERERERNDDEKKFFEFRCEVQQIILMRFIHPSSPPSPCSSSPLRSFCTTLQATSCTTLQATSCTTFQANEGRRTKENRDQDFELRLKNPHLPCVPPPPPPPPLPPPPPSSVTPDSLALANSEIIPDFLLPVPAVVVVVVVVNPREEGTRSGV